MRALLAEHRFWVYGAAFFLLSLALTFITPPPSGVYAMEGDLVFTTPNFMGEGNALRAEPSNVIFFAAAVEREYNVTPELPRMASTSATLYGMGVRDGARVTLPDLGGQWASNFSRPYLRVEVVSNSAEETQARFDRVVTQLRSIAQQRQDAAAVPLRLRVTLERSPPRPVTEYVSGRYSRQLLAGILLGALGAAALITVGNRRGGANRRRSRLEAL